MNIGQRIKQRRIQLGLTQEALAELLNTNQNQVWKYENGKNKPTSDVLVALAHTLETTSDWLLGLTEDVTPIPMETDLAETEKYLIRTYRAKSPESQHKLIEMARII